MLIRWEPRHKLGTDVCWMDPCTQILDGFIELDDGKIYKKALYFMVKTMVSCRFSLKPIQWWMAYDASVLNCYRFAGSLGRGISPSELIRSSCFFIRPSHWSKRRALGVRSKTNKKQTRLTEAIVLGGSGKTYGIKISVDFSTDFAWSAEYPMCHVGQMVLNTRLWQKPTHFLRMSSSSVKVGSHKKKTFPSYAIICNHMQSYAIR